MDRTDKEVEQAIGILEECRTAIKPQTMAEIDAWHLLGEAIDYLCYQL